MNKADYIDQVEEQLRAYGFNYEGPQSVDNSSSVFSRTDDGVAPRLRHHEVIVIDQLEEYNVDAIEAAIETMRDIHDVLDIETQTRFDSKRWYLLIVAAEVTKPMKIRAERAAGEELADDSDGFLLPVIVNLEDSQLNYNEPSTLRRATTHGKMASNVEKYFRL